MRGKKYLTDFAILESHIIFIHNRVIVTFQHAFNIIPIYFP